MAEALGVVAEAVACSSLSVQISQSLVTISLSLTTVEVATETRDLATIVTQVDLALKDLNARLFYQGPINIQNVRKNLEECQSLLSPFVRPFTSPEFGSWDELLGRFKLNRRESQKLILSLVVVLNLLASSRAVSVGTFSSILPLVD
jgi:hypothetical protein